MKFNYQISNRQFRNFIFQWRNLELLRWSCFMTFSNFKRKNGHLSISIFNFFILHMHAWKSTNDFKQAILNHYWFLLILFCKCAGMFYILLFSDICTMLYLQPFTSSTSTWTMPPAFVLWSKSNSSKEMNKMGLMVIISVFFFCFRNFIHFK